MFEFEWDPLKAADNARKHGITFHDEATVFGDPLAVTYADPDHSIEEDRFITIGSSGTDRLLYHCAYRPRRPHSNHQCKKCQYNGAATL